MLKELTQVDHEIHKYKIPYAVFIKLRSFALNHLNLSNINHLRDKFEGQDYLNRFLLKCYSEIAFNKAFQSETFDLEIYKKYKSYKQTFKLADKKTELIFSDFENYPLIPKGDYEIATIIFVNLFSRETWILGYLEMDILKILTKTQSLSPILSRNNLGYFKFFKEIKTINSC
ncbi:hypothetical protein [Pedobacter metabolipauper]|uniref:Uncharacterized protein n=1 Tax=Pedobacter metabolipauper TaxID=425513 RepID=A0A4R6SZ97_9SPHI|nr:hypothetical protein [Pedobacter metabolipauper]TDQ11397.1 hypothetical protein ATK78_0517 [Pedobacter metabolipauper]